MSAYDRLIAAGAEHWAFGIHGTKGDENVNAALDRIAAPSPALTREALAAAIHSSNDHDNRPGCLDMDLDSADAILSALSKIPPPTEEERA